MESLGCSFHHSQPVRSAPGGPLGNLRPLKRTCRVGLSSLGPTSPISLLCERCFPCKALHLATKCMHHPASSPVALCAVEQGPEQRYPPCATPSQVAASFLQLKATWKPFGRPDLGVSTSSDLCESWLLHGSLRCLLFRKRYPVVPVNLRACTSIRGSSWHHGRVSGLRRQHNVHQAAMLHF